jgi:indoleamine 2,3-dioxygenase
MTELLIDNLNTFEMSPQRGFLPSDDPLDRLPAELAPWDEIAGDLPKLLAASRCRAALERLPILDTASLQTGAEYERAMLLLSYLGHAYVWGQSPPADWLPAGVAVPWSQVADHLGRPPVLSYASYALHNWRRFDLDGPVALGNIALLQNFLGGMDEEWFILVHVEIEAHAAAALQEIGPAQHAVADDRPSDLLAALARIVAALKRMNITLARMPEGCDPYIYFQRVRPYLYGWKDQPALPDGLLYEGVERFRGQRQKFRGETGAQSSIIPSLDAALGISHREDPLRTYLTELREYAPPAHRSFADAVQCGLPIRKYVSDHRADDSLRDTYNACVLEIEQFRSTHLDYANRYIHQQAERSTANPSSVGTGGTPFMPYLKKHRDETTDHLIA